MHAKACHHKRKWHYSITKFYNRFQLSTEYSSILSFKIVNKLLPSREFYCTTIIYIVAEKISGHMTFSVQDTEAKARAHTQVREIDR